MKVFALALAAALFAGQTVRPVTIVSEVRAAITAHDLARAEALVAERRAALVAAIGAAIEVQAQMSADSGARSDAIAYLQRELEAQIRLLL